VLLSAVIHNQLGIIISEGDAQVSDCVVQTHKDREHGRLVAADDEEDVWAWNDGKKWGDELPLSVYSQILIDFFTFFNLV
jgi:hypothetical protein